MNWLQRLFNPGSLERGLDAELRFHLDRLTADYVREGMTEEEARRRAQIEFGGLDQMKEQCRDARGTLWVEAAWQDLCLALRMLRKSPGFTSAVAATLALGLGANTAIFSVVYAVLLKPLPYSDPGRLVSVAGVVPQLRARIPSVASRARDFLEYRRSNRVFAGMSAVKGVDFNLTGEGDAERVSGARVSANFFTLAGVQPALGRSFLAEEDQPGRDRVVVISHGLWTRRFGADPGILNRTILLDGERYAVVGVARTDFLFPSGEQLHPHVPFGPHVDIWKPMAFTKGEREHNGNWSYGVIARLKPGVSAEQARQNLDAIAAAIPRPGGVAFETRITPLSEAFSGQVRQGLMVILATTGLLLLIACVNLANLLLSRMSAREREFATRAALGAGRGRLVRQVLTESVVIASIGGAAGLLVAHWGTRLLASLAPPNTLTMRSPELNGPVLLYATIVALLTGVAFGLVPALRAARPELYENLGARTGGSERHAGRLRRILVAAEVALSTGLLAAAGLLLHSFARLTDVPTGFTVERILSADLSLPQQNYPPERTAAFYQRLTERVRALPGVTAAGAISAPPLGRSSESGPVFLESDTTAERVLERPFAAFPCVTHGYFAAMGVPVLAGRAFEEREPAPVTIISLGLARRLWPAERLTSILGRRLKLNHFSFAPAAIVGVTGDVRAEGLDQEAPLIAYRPEAQAPWRDMTLVVRAAQDPEALIPAVRSAVAGIDRAVPLSAMATMREIISDSVAPRRYQMTLIALFAVLSLALAAVGIYGVASYAIARQTREIGLRIALGARSEDVLRSALAQGLRPVAAGLVLGLWVAGAAALWMRTLLFEIQPLDPAALGGACGVLLLSATAACYLPARRAARVDPVIALRTE